MLANVLQFFFKSVITYGLLLYGTAYKTNLSKIEAVQRRILRAIFSKEILSLWKNCLLTTKFWLCLNFSWLKYSKNCFDNWSLNHLVFSFNQTKSMIPCYQTRCQKKNLFAPTYSRTVTNEKSLTNCLPKAYNWLKIWFYSCFTLENVPSSIKTAYIKGHITLHCWQQTTFRAVL